MRRLAAAETSFPLTLTVPLGGGVLRSQVTPRAPEPTLIPSQEGSSNGWPVPLLGEVRGGLISGRFMESLHSLLHMHWDHEPRNWSAELQPGAINVSLARRTWRSWSSALRFMKSQNNRDSTMPSSKTGPRSVATPRLRLWPSRPGARPSHCGGTSNIQHPTPNNEPCAQW